MNRKLVIIVGVLIAMTVRAQEMGPVPRELPSATEPDSETNIFTAVESPRWWFQGDYMMAWMSQAPTANYPLLVASSGNNLVPPLLGSPGSRVLFGNDPTDFGLANGLRLRTGAWFEQNGLLGFELAGTIIEQKSAGSTFSSDASGLPIIGIPIINTNTNDRALLAISAPANFGGGFSGAAAVIQQTNYFQWEANILFNLLSERSLNSVAWMGVKSAGLDSRLSLLTVSQNLPGSTALMFNRQMTAPGEVLSIEDAFRTENRFYGPQLGTRFGIDRGTYALGAFASVAMGVTQQEQILTGSTTLSGANRTTATMSGGSLVVASNAGKYNRDVFSVMPEAGLNLDWRLTSWITAKVGYTFSYWTNVARASNISDPNVNPALVPSDVDFGNGGVGRPGGMWKNNDFWIQGVTFGIEIRR